MRHHRRLVKKRPDKSTPFLKVIRLAEVHHVIFQRIPLNEQNITVRLFDGSMKLDALSASRPIEQRYSLCDAGLELRIFSWRDFDYCHFIHHTTLQWN
jgi:hypothetical protein